MAKGKKRRKESEFHEQGEEGGEGNGAGQPKGTNEAIYHTPTLKSPL